MARRKGKNNKERRVYGTQGSVPASPVLETAVREKITYPKREEILTPPPPPPKPPHVAVEHKVEELKLPDLADFPYNWIEFPRSKVKANGLELFDPFLGETDKKRILILVELVKRGYKIKSMQATPQNTYLFLLEK